MAAALTPDQKLQLITQNLGEVLGEDRLKAILAERDLTCYWGTAPTGRPHLGYFVPLAKLSDFLTAGVKVKVLLADVHAFLDNLKAPIELVAHRAEYYRLLILAVFRSLHLPLDLVEFTLGSSYQYTPEYTRDAYKLASITSERDARKAGAEVVKQSESPPLSGLLYPLLQALDEEYLGVDFQFGGIDQRKIFTYAEEYLPKLGYTKRAHLMNTMVPGLAGGKMSASDPNSKIDFLDSAKEVEAKLKKAVCAPGQVEGNGVLAFVKAVLVPIGELMVTQGRGGERVWVGQGAPRGTVFTTLIKGREGKADEEVHFGSADELERAYGEEKVHPMDLKAALGKGINALLEPIRNDYNNDPAFKAAKEAAYPEPVKVAAPKKVKKYTPKPDHLKTDEERARDAAAAAAAAAAAGGSGGGGLGNGEGLEETEGLANAIAEAASA